MLHCLRDDPAFVPELDFVLEKDGQLIGQNVFMRAAVAADNGTFLPILTMGPICIAPAYKRQGYGEYLLDFRLEKAAASGAGAICFEGNIDFYKHCGFTYASRFEIRYHGLPEGETAPSFCAVSCSPTFWTALPANILRPRATLWMRPQLRPLTKASRLKRSRIYPVSYSEKRLYAA